MGIVQNLYTNIDNGLKGLNKGLSTGLPKLDEITGGVQRSTYYTIFGLSGTGKSALLSYCYFYRLLKDNPNKDILIILYSLEVSAEIVYAKLLSLYLYETYGNHIYISILSQFTPLKGLEEYPELNRKLREEEYNEVVDYAIEIGVENGFIQEGDVAEESFIPDFDGQGVWKWQN